MNVKKHYHKKEIQKDLYQYEMGIEFGVEEEKRKRRHEKEYDDHVVRKKSEQPKHKSS